MENTETPGAQKPKTVKAVASSPIYAMFDLIEVEGKQVVTGSIGFKDQFGMDRMARCAGEKGVLNLGKHILAIYNGQIDVIEPDDATKAELLKQAVNETKEAVKAGEIKPEAPAEAEIIPFKPEGETK